MQLGIFLHKLNREETPTDQAGIVVGPQLTGAAVAIPVDDDARKIRRLPRVIAVLDYILESQPVSLIFQLPLVSVHHGQNSNLRQKQARVSNEPACGNARNYQPDPLCPRLLHLAAGVYLKHVSHLVTENECKLGFVVDRAQQTSVDEHRSSRQRRRINLWILHNKKAELDGPGGSLGSLRNQ